VFGESSAKIRAPAANTAAPQQTTSDPVMRFMVAVYAARRRPVRVNRWLVRNVSLATTLQRRSATLMTAPAESLPAPTSKRWSLQLALAALAGGAVAVALGTYAKVHDPTFRPVVDLGFPSVIDMKAWLATITFALALAQLVSALWMYGRLPVKRPAPRSIGTVHRWTGTAAFVVSLPVAYHCLWSLGFAENGTREVLHSIFGCAFYGAFATKLLALRIDGLPRFGLPIIGGLLVTLLTALWLTSSLWFFTNVGFPFA
jgi:Family of unknown function (DUF6529)